MDEPLYTETKFLRLDLPEEGFRTERGGVLRRVDVAYETCGTLSPARDNVVFICHALTGDSHVAGRHRGDAKDTGWWANMVRPGGGIDLSRHFVVCANILGGCKGTTGPSSLDPDTGRPYGSAFPSLTVGDVAEIHHRFLVQLGFSRVYAIVGGSFGGMQTMEIGIRYPDFAEKLVCIASGSSLTTQALAFDVVGRGAIEKDPDFRGGDYYGGPAPQVGLAQARKLAHITYLSEEMMKEKFGRRRRERVAELENKSAFEVESYLEHQGRKFIGRFDANSYLRITEAMDNYDMAGDGTLDERLAAIRARILVVSLSGDWLFLPEQSAEIVRALHAGKKDVSYFPLEAPAGHDAFLTHIGELQKVLAGFLRQSPDRPAPKADEDHLRDYDTVEKLIPENARTIIDLACGDGELLNFIAARRPEADCSGIDIDAESGMRLLAAGHNASIADINEGFGHIPDRTYDCAILSESLQVLHRPDKTIEQLLRIAPVVIVSFPNFGMWKVRGELFFTGRMPVTKRLPYQWYDTPNIRCLTLADFRALCREHGLYIEKMHCLATLTLSKVLNFLGFKNLGSSRVIARIRR